VEWWKAGSDWGELSLVKVHAIEYNIIFWRVSPFNIHHDLVMMVYVADTEHHQAFVKVSTRFGVK
jgi:hypothetical protein